MQIWVDDDACPNAIKEILYWVAKRVKFPLVLIANSMLHSHTPDGVLDFLLLPNCRALARIATRLRRTLHQGIIGIYLLYTALTLCFLLFLSIFFN